MTAHLAAVLAAAKTKKSNTQVISDPRKVRVKLPTSRIPKDDSIVSFNFLFNNAKRFHPDYANSQDVKLIALAKKQFKNGAKGVVTSTLTDIPEYSRPHKYQQVIRCTPADYDGKVIDCPGVVANCTCLRFLYTWNWVLWAKNAAVLNATNEPPDATNGARHIGTCKHLVVSMNAIRKRGL